MSFIDRLRLDREALATTLEKHKGIRRLIEDFYPDNAHFIYELLQNAEDTGATEAAFDLSQARLVFEHNGSRPFTERDVESITDIGASSKQDDAEKIGKFGVGFKSVFVYTETPLIYSKTFSFRITKLVLPEAVRPVPGLGERTRFEFPFNSSKKSAIEAHADVKRGLKELADTTLLFLTSLRCISWQFDEGRGEVLRERHSEAHIEILKAEPGGKSTSSHWLRFDAPVRGLERQTVAIAYELSFTADQAAFEPSKPLSKQMKVVPAERGSVAVFFPAEKEESGLRFHLHAPFIPELSRASIKESKANEPLFEQLAALAARSLHWLKAEGLLTGEFLAVLPSQKDPVRERYRVIRESLISEMREQPLTPTHARGHGPAKRLLQAKAALKDLLSDDDVMLVVDVDGALTWAISPNQRGSEQEKFLSSLEIPSWDVEDFVEAIAHRTTHSSWPDGFSTKFMQWLASKSDEWHQQLYAVLYRTLMEQEDFSLLDEAQVIRRTDGSYGRGRETFLPSESDLPGDPFPRVPHAILVAGSKKVQQSDARNFLLKVGVRPVGDSERIELLLRERYGSEGDAPADSVYLSDLKRFVDYVEKNPAEAAKFEGAYVFRVKGADFDWATPEHVYVDAPYRETELRHYHEALPPDSARRWPLSDWYRGCGVEASRIAAFAQAVGCRTTFTEFVVEASCVSNPQWGYLQQVPGERYTTPIDRDFSTSNQIYALLQAKDVDFAKLAWRTVCALSPRFLFATYQRSERGGSRRVESTLVHLLRQASWVPLQGGQFVRPCDASREGLLSGFAYDAGYDWLKHLRFGESEQKKAVEGTERAKRRAELGFRSEEDLQRALAFASLSIEEQEEFLEEHKRRQNEPVEEFPDRPMRNPETRTQRMGEEARQTPEKESVLAQRSVSVGYEEMKLEAKMYLQEQYTNPSGVMFCQVCKSPLPFRVPSGAYYFEAVEAVSGLPKRFRPLFLCLCPNHAAMFQYANESKQAMKDLLELAVGREVEITLAGQPMTILFTAPHLADIGACLRTLEEEASR